jgi:hypothetical protein
MWLDITEALWQNLSYPSPPWLFVGFFYLAVINDLIHNILKAFFFFFLNFNHCIKSPGIRSVGLY